VGGEAEEEEGGSRKELMGMGTNFPSWSGFPPLGLGFFVCIEGGGIGYTK